MKLKFNRDHGLEIVNFGVFRPGEIIKIDNESKAKKYLDTGYFDKVKENKINKEFERKGDDR